MLFVCKLIAHHLLLYARFCVYFIRFQFFFHVWSSTKQSSIQIQSEMQHFISVNSAYGLKCGLTPLILIKIDRLYIFLPLILRILLHISTSQRFSMFVKSLKKLRIKKQSSALDFYLLSHKMFHRYCQCALCPAVANRLQKNAQLGEKVETKECLQMRAL